MSQPNIHRRRFFALGAGALALPHMARAAGATAHAFVFEPLEGAGQRIALADYAGRPVLVVNTASRCGFTPQYDGLQALWETYRERGLVVVGAPSRDFGRQEYEDEGAIKDFCEVNFAIDFPMSGLVRVKGPQAHPFYAWAAAEGRGRDLPAPRWNFHKYLIGPDGGLAGAWDSAVDPQSAELTETIEALLPAG
ncbi:glutathione peroxidase [Albimonas sp. CAU 1670]|uniref:glutathione peroxidase n=1 Tax=Albimonas sp. CAU 1670 TaxID=3032599 RepID=UPI0023DC56EC|nr:glutathione peroxidase [Albimonas sp. CAU 1670]MDF2232988.1 glutathione peroxidase [Albimonas sp. CAU 1670]